VAVNCCVPLVRIETEVGEIETETAAVTPGVVAAWLPDKEQPAKDRISNERIASI